jgi:hypothetical protein
MFHSKSLYQRVLFIGISLVALSRAGFSLTPTPSSTLNPSSTNTPVLPTATPTPIVPTFTATPTLLLTATQTPLTAPSSTASMTPLATASPTPLACPQSFFFGYGLTGSNTLSFTGNRFDSESAVLPEDASVNTLMVECTAASGGQITMAIYADGGGVPGTLLAQSASQVAVLGWNSLPILALSLPAGRYWLAVEAQSGVSIAYDTGSSGDEYFQTLSYGAAPASFGAGTVGAKDLSIQAFYCEDYSYVGNMQYVQNAWTLPMSTSSNMLGYRFQERGNKTVNAVQLDIASVSGSPPTYEASIQADSGGLPSGIPLSSATFVPAAAGWMNLSMPATALVDGQTYHLVLQYLSGTVSSGKSATLSMGVYPSGRRFTQDQSYDPVGQVEINYGSGWTQDELQSSVMLGYSDSSWFGSVYDDIVYYEVSGEDTPADPWDDDVVSEVFVPSTSWTVDHIGVYGNASAAGVADGLYYEILDVAANNVVAQGTLCSAASAPLVSTWMEVALPGTYTLTAGKTYQLLLTSPGSSSSVDWQIVPTDSTYEGLPLDLCSYNGNQSFAEESSTGGATWTVWTASDLAFRFRQSANNVATSTPTSTATYTPTCNSLQEGNTNIGAQPTPDEGFLDSARVSFTTGGTVTGVGVYLATSGTVRVALYNQVSSAPSALLATSNAIQGVAGWNIISLPPTAVSASTYYLAFQTLAPAQVAFNTGSTGVSYYQAWTWGSFPSTFGSGAPWTQQWSIYALLCVADTPTPTKTPNLSFTLTASPNATATPTWSPSPTSIASSTSTPLPSSTATPTPFVGCVQEGETTILGGSTSMLLYMYFLKIVVPVPGYVNDINYYRSSTGTGATAMVGLYSDNGGGTAPQNLLFSSAKQSVSSTFAWNSILLSTTVLSPGIYWLAVQGDGNIASFASGGSSYQVLHTYNNFNDENPVSGGSASAIDYSLYADFCAVVATATPTFSVSPTDTSTWTPTTSLTDTSTWTSTVSPTPSPTPTGTPTISLTLTSSFSPTSSPTLTNTATLSLTATATPSATLTMTPSGTATDTSTWTFTVSPTPSPTPTGTPTISLTFTLSFSPTDSPTLSDTPTPSFSVTVTPSATLTMTPSGTATDSSTWTPSRTETPTLSPSDTATLSPSPSPSSTLTTTLTWTLSVTSSNTRTDTATASPTKTVSDTSTFTATRTTTPTLTSSGTPSSTHTPSATRTSSPTQTISKTPSFSPTQSASVTYSPSWTATKAATAVPTVTSTRTPMGFSPTHSPTPLPTGTVAVPVVTNRNVFHPLQGESCTISIKAPQDGQLTVRVFDISGELVRPVFDASVRAGLWFLATWDGKNGNGEMVSSGIYFISVRGAGIRTIKKVVVLK